MDWQALTLVGMFLAALLYIATLYHLAHGRERKAVELGARLVMEALTRDGRIMADMPAAQDDGPINIGEEEYQQAEDDNQQNGMPDILVARSEKAAKQLAEQLVKQAVEGVKK